MPPGFFLLSDFLWVLGGWPTVPRGTGVQFHHDSNSRGCRTLCVFLFCKACGFRSNACEPAPRSGSRFLPANRFQIVLGLLLRVLRGLLGIGIRLQLMDSFVQVGGQPFRAAPTFRPTAIELAGCRTLCVFLFRKGCGFRSNTYKPSLAIGLAISTRQLLSGRPWTGGRPFRAAPVFSFTTIQTRGGAALFAFFFSAKGAGLDLTLANLRCDRARDFYPPIAFRSSLGGWPTVPRGTNVSSYRH